MNAEIVKLQADIVAIINQSKLPVEVKRLVVREVLDKLTAARDEAVKQEQLSLKEKEVSKNGKEV